MPAECLDQIVSIGGWPRDEEFAIHPYGTKSKRTLVCPAEEAPGLRPGHRYLFKRAEGWKHHQLWSEAIAHQVSALAGLDVPRCYVGRDETTGETGALIEFFYGHPGMADNRELRHGADLLQGAGLMDADGAPHVAVTNMGYCADAGIAGAEDWWARVYAFDALIGNVDRHAENWGFLVGEDRVPGMAPVFDNGTSLGYEIQDTRISAVLAGLDRYLANGRHRCGWSATDAAPAGHIALCERIANAYPATRAIMAQTVNISIDELRAVAERCARLAIEPRFLDARAEFITTLVERRQALLLEALES